MQCDRTAGQVATAGEPVTVDSQAAFALHDQLDRAFTRLSKDHRTVIVLHHYLGYTVEDAAAAIGIPIGTAKSRLHYATDALRAALEADARTTATRQVIA